MNSFRPQDFEEVLDAVEHQVSSLIECDHVGSIGGNLNTRGMAFRARNNPHKVGTVIVGEDRRSIAVDISLLDGAIRSFILRDSDDREGINNIVGWFEQNYS